MNEEHRHYLERCRQCNEIFGTEAYQSGECSGCYTTFSKEQRRNAEQDPSLYFQNVPLLGGESSTVIRQAEYLDLPGKILKVFGVFAVTEKGIECLTHSYFIENSRLKEDWLSHMSEKNWVTTANLEDALTYARAAQ